jgi:hypothetical protein
MKYLELNGDRFLEQVKIEKMVSKNTPKLNIPSLYVAKCFSIFWKAWNYFPPQKKRKYATDFLFLICARI